MIVDLVVEFLFCFISSTHIDSESNCCNFCCADFIFLNRLYDCIVVYFIPELYIPVIDATKQKKNFTVTIVTPD